MGDHPGSPDSPDRLWAVSPALSHNCHVTAEASRHRAGTLGTDIARVDNDFRRLRHLMAQDVPVRFLLVQDDPVDEVLTRESFDLHKLRNALHSVRNVGQAFSYLDQIGQYAETPVPDMVLLDLNLPGADGRHVLRRLRNDPATAEVPVVLLVDSPVAEEILRSQRLPVQGYALKPVDFPRLADIVRTMPWLGFAVMRDRAAGRAVPR